MAVIKTKADRLVTLFFLTSIMEGLIVFTILLTIPGDPKNSFLLGYSKNRFVLLAATFAILAGLLVGLLTRRFDYFPLYKRIANWSRLKPRVFWIGGLALILLWVTIFTPAYRLKELAASFFRLQPILIWVELLVIQFALLAMIKLRMISFKAVREEFWQNRKLFFLGGGGVCSDCTRLSLLAVLNGDFSVNQLYFPPGAPISGLQTISVWILILLFSSIRIKIRVNVFLRNFLPILVFFVIWISTTFMWLSVPFECTDDLIGPYPPNNICYPQINDAVYSIGSHYINLGQGVYNRWLTDKPLYMAFLALGQAVTGPNIEEYLKFQVIVVALVPSLLFIAGKKKICSP